MATATSQAGQAWHHALKVRKGLLKQLDKLQADSASGTDASLFEAIDGLLEKFRLGCVHTIFLDFKYAVKENTEEALWGIHTSLNTEYRRILARLRSNSHAVERRKVEKTYNNFLRIAQKFYKGYIQRLSARYDVPELRRVAQGIDVEQMDVRDTIRQVPAALSGMVLQSCHSTLLRLGDLARYRIQAKHKTSGYDMALTYYGLARHLMPQSGFAFHQMAIVKLDQANHLDVVYHFYRAWAVEIPHPNAKSNLESEFKSLRLPSTAKARHNPSAPQDAFSTWFVKLHAFFHRGEPFSQQKELEEEVMHRLEMACRNPSSGDTLLKMALVNMSAYDVASKAFAEEETESVSRFWHFTLRFNALFVMTFCRALQSELQEAVTNRDDGSRSETSVQLTSIIENLLPTLRIYCVWLGARQQELFGAANAFGALVPTMVQHIVEVFTLLCAVSHSQDNLAPCPYLLPEDLEMRGIRPLTGEQVPQACAVYCDGDGNMKPYLHGSEQRFDATKEHLARILDVLRCAYFLAEDGVAPISCQVAENGLVFEYRPGGTSDALRDKIEAVSTSSAGQHVASLSEPSAEQTPAREAQDSGQPRASKEKSIGMADQQEYAPGQATCPLSAEEEHTEKTVIAMLTPFLKPPSPPPRQHARSPEESSYGMHTTTANEVLGSFQTYSSPIASGQRGSIAPFPWAWDNTPKPDGVQDAATSAGKEAFMRTSRDNSPKEAMAMRTSLEDPFTSPGRDVTGPCAQTHLELPKAGNRDGSTPWSGTGDAHRDHLLQSFTTTSVPRTSPFASWGDDHGTAWPNGGATLSPWGPRVCDPVPEATGTSGFSHLSSLYLSTQPGDIGLGLSGYGNDGRNLGQSPAQGVDEASTRRVQIGDSASSYDDAIFRAAWLGR